MKQNRKFEAAKRAVRMHIRANGLSTVFPSHLAAEVSGKMEVKIFSDKLLSGAAKQILAEAEFAAAVRRQKHSVTSFGSLMAAAGVTAT